MNSIILNVTARMLLPGLIILSLLILYRGHNLPGGGFIGGLAAASAFILYTMGFGVKAAKAKLRVTPEALLAVGLLIAIASGLPAVFGGEAYLTGGWLPTFHLPMLGAIHLGTPLIFDIGVYFVVMGFTLLTVFTLSEHL